MSTIPMNNGKKGPKKVSICFHILKPNPHRLPKCFSPYRNIALQTTSKLLLPINSFDKNYCISQVHKVLGSSKNMFDKK
jgi:hypothetical protein